MAKLEELAKELETFTDRQKEFRDILIHIRNDGYPRETLIKELVSLRLRYFAEKVRNNYYELIEKIKNESNN